MTRRPAHGPSIPLYSGYQEVNSLRVKQPGADFLPPCNIDIKNGGALLSFPRIAGFVPYAQWETKNQLNSVYQQNAKKRFLKVSYKKFCIVCFKKCRKAYEESWTSKAKQFNKWPKSPILFHVLFTAALFPADVQYVSIGQWTLA
jgi:hypothetical protein